MSFLIISFLTSAAAAAMLLTILARVLPSGFLAAVKNERSNHTVSARQIGGLAVIPAALAALLVFGPAAGLDMRLLLSLMIAATLLWLTGFFDDRHSLPVAVRLCAQIIAAGLCVYGLGPDFRLLPNLLPQWLEALLMVFALLSFINMTNFMDGLDLMTVTGIGIPLVAAALFALLGMTAPQSGLIAAATGGALLGFAFFNTPPARIFLGDSGSLPLGLLSGVVFLMVAREAALLAGLLLPLYYLLETGSTLVMRLLAGENVLAAHSKHGYQIARRSGWPVLGIIGRVAAINILLAICAASVAGIASPAETAVFTVTGFAATVALLLRFRGIL
ncbi:glycoside hydrolase [Paramesorhizobium deserti]|uniref:Glycoside hydrolase n=1 Tax=Paramesorhizobium deserti TaxID=1494590 RepID=A0A135HYS0_9HYPH|nr:glycoside hydrolase [Paramesorhizobium deserti]KXF78329.1 glycoside hydrolase [Paramesorhizobium deserti]